MPNRIQEPITELLIMFWVSLGIAKYIPTINMYLDLLFTVLSIVSAIGILIINYDKIVKRVKKFLK